MHSNQYNEFLSADIEQNFSDGYQNNFQIINPYQQSNPMIQNVFNRNIPYASSIRQPNYINYPMETQSNANIPSNYTHYQPMGMNMNYRSNRDFYAAQNKYIRPHNVNNGYVPQINCQQEYISNQKHQFFVQQFKITVNMAKKQNNLLLQKLKHQNKKLIQQFRAIKDIILSGDRASAINAERLMENVKGTNSLALNRYLTQKKSQINKMDTQTGSNQKSSLNDKRKVESLANIPSKLMNRAQIFEKTIQSLKQKKKIKIQTHETIQQKEPGFNKISPDILTNKSNQKPNKLLQQSSTQPISISDRFQDQHQNQQDQPEYPADFSGQESYLVDDQVIATESRRNAQNSSSKNAKFGILRDPKQSQRYAFKSKAVRIHTQEDSLQQQIYVEQFFNTFLCQKLQYAPKKVFKNFKVTKQQLRNLYLHWRRCSHSQSEEVIVGDSLFQYKLTNQFKRRFSSSLTEKNCFTGVRFKNNLTMNDLVKIILNSK